MQLSLSADQRAVLDAIDSLVRPFSETPANARGFVLASDDLDRALAEGGFLEVALDPDLGLTTAALITERLARLPYAVEVGASAFVRPLLGEIPRPLCVADATRPYAPIRYLKPGATVVAIGPEVTSFTARLADIAPIEEALYAYPVAALATTPPANVTRHQLDAQLLVARWRAAIAAEIAGLLRGAIDATVQYVSDRKQFGRPLGAFQAIRHRLAEAHARTEGARWLALKAASTQAPGDAALAAHFAQATASQVVYDLHQFLGAMGVTLEHSLHLWTYRLKALIGELGGSLAHAKDAAGLIWESDALTPP